MAGMTREEGEAFALDVYNRLMLTPSPLGDQITRSLNNYSVAFLVEENGELKPAGSGTTVSYRGIDYFLTAAHVWHDKLKRAKGIAVPLKENSRKHFSIKPSVLVASGPEQPPTWSAWGPDIILLRIPPELVGRFRANGRSFHNMSDPIRRSLTCCVDAWFQFGAPAEKGTYTHDRGIPEMQAVLIMPPTGYFGPVSRQTRAADQFDFVDVLMDSSIPDAPSRPHGISGGGLWRVYFYKNAEGEIGWMRVLEGVAFWWIPQSERNKFVIRCHGPQSIGRTVKYLEEETNSSLWPGQAG